MAFDKSEMNSIAHISDSLFEFVTRIDAQLCIRLDKLIDIRDVRSMRIRCSESLDFYAKCVNVD